MLLRFKKKITKRKRKEKNNQWRTTQWDPEKKKKKKMWDTTRTACNWGLKKKREKNKESDAICQCSFCWRPAHVWWRATVWVCPPALPKYPGHPSWVTAWGGSTGRASDLKILRLQWPEFEPRQEPQHCLVSFPPKNRKQSWMYFSSK